MIDVGQYLTIALKAWNVKDTVDVVRMSTLSPLDVVVMGRDSPMLTAKEQAVKEPLVGVMQRGEMRKQKLLSTRRASQSHLAIFEGVKSTLGSFCD